ESSNPLLKSLAWMLVGLGLVGLVLFAAQKYLFNRNAEPGPGTEQAQAQPATSTPDQSSKPSPVGGSNPADAPAKEGPKPASSPETTTPEAPPDKAQPNTPAEAPREPRPAIPPPVQVTKADATQSVQFVTDPPNAQLTIDG